VAECAKPSAVLSTIVPGGLGDACSGALVCKYGTAVCCRVSHPLDTCTCTAGSFICTMSECNIICPDVGRG